MIHPAHSFTATAGSGFPVRRSNASPKKRATSVAGMAVGHSVRPTQGWTIAPPITATAGATAAAVVAGLGFLATSGGPSAATGASEMSTAAASALPGVTPNAEPSAAPTPSPVAGAADPGGMGQIKNVVLVLADDMDWSLFQQVPRLAALQDQGMTFTRHIVTDSLCCPSRTSIMRGQYVHNHRVVSNTEATGGGWPTFRARGEQKEGGQAHVPILPEAVGARPGAMLDRRRVWTSGRPSRRG